MSKFQIVSRHNRSQVLFECDIPEHVESGLAMRHALEKAVAARADLKKSESYMAQQRPLLGGNLRLSMYLKHAYADVVVSTLGGDNIAALERLEALLAKYPTDFNAMPGEWIDRLSLRGEQLTLCLARAYIPQLIREGASTDAH